MKRIRHAPRPDWQTIVQREGQAYAVDGVTGLAYWHEEHAYELSGPEVDYLERATETAHTMCVQAAGHLLDRDQLWATLALPDAARAMLRASLHDERDWSLYGRFDLAWAGDGTGPAKILEYNADTPAGLVEASVCQWTWLDVLHPDLDQWNMIHERLVKAWAGLAGAWPHGLHRVHLAAGEDEPREDWITVAYLADTATEAGLKPVILGMEDVGWHAARRRFVDLNDLDIDLLFAMYPWEWLLDEAFGQHLLARGHGTRFLEPAWKCLLSSKTILVALAEVYPGHDLVLPATLGEPGPWPGGYVAKPVFGWEGAGIQVVTPDYRHIHDPGHTGGQALVYQQATPLGSFDGAHPVLGTWVIGGKAAGLGIRESDGPVTDTGARFVPHYMTTPRSTAADVAGWLAE